MSDEGEFGSILSHKKICTNEAKDKFGKPISRILTSPKGKNLFMRKWKDFNSKKNILWTVKMGANLSKQNKIDCLFESTELFLSK